MNNIINKINEYTLQKIIKLFIIISIIAIVVLIGLIAYNTFKYKDLFDEYSEMENNYNNINLNQSQLEDIQSDFDNNFNITKYSESYKDITYISDLSNLYLDLDDFSIQGKETTSFENIPFVYTRLYLNGSGQYDNIIEFIDQLYNLDMLINVNAIDITNDPLTDNYKLHLDFQLINLD